MKCVKPPLKIFEEQTTYNLTYKDHKKKKGYVYDANHPPFSHRPQKQYKQAPQVDKDVQTMRPWKFYPPFDAFSQPKLIIRTHPAQQFGPIIKPEDTGREEAIRTRRRVYMLPQVSMDDIADPKLRKLIIDNMYTSDWKKISGEIKYFCTQREAPKSVIEDTKKQTIRFPFDMIKTFPRDWEEKCKKWDEEYPKDVVDQTEYYWKKFKEHKDTPVGQDPMMKFITDETRKEIRELVYKDELRRPFDYPTPGYMGYMPNYVIGPLKEENVVKSPTLHLWQKEG